MVRTLCFMLLMAFAGCSHAPKQHQHHHHHGKATNENDQRLKLNDGKKWVPDAILRENMESMHTGLVEVMKKEKDYRPFSQLVTSRTETIINNCKMSPEMDEAYHVILERMLNANEKLQDKKLQKEAIGEFISAFMDYQKFFDHELKH